MSDTDAATLREVDVFVPPATQEVLPADRQLQPVIGPWAVAANCINSAVGGGFFALPGLIAAILGPAALVSYLLCGVAIALVLTCYAEIGSVVHRSGGGVAYIEEAFGPLAGFLAFVTYALGFSMVSAAAIGNLLVDAAAALFPQLSHGIPRALALLFLFSSLAAVNIRGVRHGVRLTIVTTIAKLIPLLLLIVVGLFYMHRGNFHWTGAPSLAKLGEGSLLTFFAYQGAETALGPSAEIHNPRRTVPLAILYATIGLVLIYVLLQLVCQGVLGPQLGLSITVPLAEVAGTIAGRAGSTLLLVTASVSILGALATNMMCNPRIFFLVAQNGMLPTPLSRVHPRFRTPYISIIVAACLTFLLAIAGVFRQLAVLSVVSTLCIYLAICVAALRLRYTRSQEPGAFRARGGPTVAILGSLPVLWLLSSSTRREIAILAATLLLATTYFFIKTRVLSRRVKQAPAH